MNTKIICGKFSVTKRVSVTAALFAMLSACAGEKEMLLPIEEPTPAGVDLSGRWVMQDDFDDMKRRIERAIRRTDGVDEKKILRRMTSQRGGRASSRDVGGLVHVFLENAANLKITQTDNGLFISFNRSIVEEYRFGEARIIRTGGAVAQRVSGWNGDIYVIETLDEDGMKLTERYTLLNSNRTLTREITLRSNKSDTVTILQTYGAEKT